MWQWIGRRKNVATAAEGTLRQSAASIYLFNKWLRMSWSWIISGYLESTMCLFHNDANMQHAVQYKRQIEKKVIRPTGCFHSNYTCSSEHRVVITRKFTAVLTSALPISFLRLRCTAVLKKQPIPMGVYECDSFCHWNEQIKGSESRALSQQQPKLRHSNVSNDDLESMFLQCSQDNHNSQNIWQHKAELKRSYHNQSALIRSR